MSDYSGYSDYEGGGGKKGGLSPAMIGSIIAAVLLIGGGAAAAVVITGGSGASGNDSDVIKSGDGLCYRVVKATEGVTKEKAEEACEEIGGTLIGKVLQEDGVFEQFTRLLGKNYAWTLLTETDHSRKYSTKYSRKFVWPGTGEAFDESDSDFVWCTKEPNNSNGKEWCTVIAGNRPSEKGDGKPCLDDRPCTQKIDPESNTNLAAICEVLESC